MNCAFRVLIRHCLPTRESGFENPKIEIIEKNENPSMLEEININMSEWYIDIFLSTLLVRVTVKGSFH